ncbi:MAG: hypothetical protein NW217_11220 [Hyphomicrobiaceae bacterium]|nr:hypothetical protein [Hyphomicrobiaceae bacterium]
MRYVVAIVIAAAVALVATLTVSAPLALFVVSRFSFESPDQVSNLHDAVYLGTSALALAAGWAIGWLVGARFEPGEDPG